MFATIKEVQSLLETNRTKLNELKQDALNMLYYLYNNYQEDNTFLISKAISGIKFDSVFAVFEESETDDEHCDIIDEIVNTFPLLYFSIGFEEGNYYPIVGFENTALDKLIPLIYNTYTGRIERADTYIDNLELSKLYYILETIFKYREF